jgi:GTP-binding protein
MTAHRRPASRQKVAATKRAKALRRGPRDKKKANAVAHWKPAAQRPELKSAGPKAKKVAERKPKKKKSAAAGKKKPAKPRDGTPPIVESVEIVAGGLSAADIEALEGEFEPGEVVVEERSAAPRVIEDAEDLLEDELFDGMQVPEEEVAEEPDTLTRDPAARPPIVAIVGRPNVGKSTLLNALSGSRISIVEQTPGVTRDRVGVLCTFADRTVELVDTGGVGIVDAAGLAGPVEEQARRAIEQADVILFVLDAREGLVPLDERVAGMLRRATDRVIAVANKAETERVTWNLGELAGLGYGEPLLISAQERIGLETLEEAVAARLPAGPTTPRRLAAPEMRLAVVGRVNAGKSSLVNSLLRQDRMIVSAVPGTTRDTVDVRFERDGKAFVVIDTAGIRKERAVQGGVEFYAQRRAERAMRRADVTALVLDATCDIGRLDRQIAGYALEHRHPVLIVVNKWDLRPPGLTTGDFGKYVRATLAGLTYAPIVFTTANTGRNVDTVIDVARGLFRQASTRVRTADLNEALKLSAKLKHPRPRHGRVGQVYYGTQVEVKPPTFVLFVNDPDLFDSTYRRYLENRFREVLPIPEVPMAIYFKARGRPAKPGGEPEA